MDILGSRIKNLRDKHDLSQKRVAQALKISNTQLSRYESGDRRPDPEMIRKIADYFDVSTDYLLGRSDDPSPCKSDLPSKSIAQEFPDLADIDPILLRRFVETIKNDPYQTLFFDNLLNASKEEREQLVRDFLAKRNKDINNQDESR